MSACGTRVGKGWQNDSDSGLFQKLLFPTRIARPVIQRWHVKSCWGCWEWWLACVACCARGLVPACTDALWSGPPAPPARLKIPCEICANKCTHSRFFPFFCVTKWMSVGKKGKVEGRRSGGDTAVEHGTISALWHQPLDSPSRSPKTLNSPTMNCCSGKGGFREFNFQHNWLYSPPLNAKEMVCSVCLCEELCLQRVSSSRRDRERKTRETERWRRQAGRMGKWWGDRNSATG